MGVAEAWGWGILKLFVEQGLSNLKINGGGDLEIAVIASDKPDGFADEFEKLNVIGHIRQGNRAGGECVNEIATAHDLRGLHRPEIVTRNGAIHASGKRPDGLLNG